MQHREVSNADTNHGNRNSIKTEREREREQTLERKKKENQKQSQKARFYAKKGKQNRSFKKEGPDLKQRGEVWVFVYRSGGCERENEMKL